MLRVVAVSLSLISYCVSIPFAHATNIGFSVNKSLFDAEILPGTTYQDELVVSNVSRDVALPIHLQLSMWNLAEDSEEDIDFVASQEAINPLKWFSLVTSGGEHRGAPATLKPLATGDDFILAPGEDEILRFRVRPPNDVAAGTYLVSMRFQAAVPEYYYESSGPRFAPEVVALFFLKVPYFSLDGTQTSYAAEILDVGLKGEREANKGVVQVAKADILDDAAKVLAAKIKNTGAFYFKASGELQIRSWTGRVVKDIPLPPKYMLPGRVRTLEIPLSSDASAGLLGRVGKYVSDNAYFGRYTATLVLNYPESGDGSGFTAGAFAQKSVQFWVLPWKFVLILAGFIGLIVIFIKQFGRRMLLALRVIFSGGRIRGRARR